MNNLDYTDTTLNSLFFSVLHDLFANQNPTTISLLMARFQAFDIDEKSDLLGELDRCKTDSERRELIEEYLKLNDDIHSRIERSADEYRSNSKNPYKDSYKDYGDSYQVNIKTHKIPEDMFKEDPWGTNVLPKVEAPVVIETKKKKKKYKSMEDLNNLVK